ncbi:MAG: hypothetical protein AB2L14_20185 [Candidatus Xenobiia bacterium LiM19]
MPHDEPIERRVAEEARLFSPWLAECEAPLFTDMCERFSGALFHMTEFSFSPGSDDVGIMFKGDGEQYFNTVLEFLEKAGIHEKGRRFLRESAALAPGSALSLKVDWSGARLPKASFYYHSLLDLPTLNACMMKLGVDEKSRAVFLGEICFLLRKERLFAGFGVSQKDRIVLKTFFMHKTGSTAFFFPAAIAASMVLLGFPSRTISLFIDLHHFLASDPNRNVFTSYGFLPDLQPVVKLDYEDIELEKIMEIYRTFKVPEPDSLKLEKICTALGTERVTYFSLRFSRDGAVSFKCYFTRRYALISDPGTISEIFKETSWTSDQDHNAPAGRAGIPE